MFFLQQGRIAKLGMVIALGLALVIGLLPAASVNPAVAQEMPPLPGTVVLADLGAPRGVSVDAAGNLLVVDAGKGGDTEIVAPSLEDPAQSMTVKAGLSGKIISVGADGTPTDLLTGLPSYALPTETIGLYRAIMQGDSLWLVYNGAGPGNFWGSSVVELDAKTRVTKNVISLFPFELANNPDGNEIDSNVADIAWGADGTLYIVDAGANALLSWTKEQGLAVVNAWKENSVPDSIEVAANGDLYIGFLGAGLAPGAGKIEHWSGGKVAHTYGNLNAVSDILLDGDKLYAVQLVVMTEQGPGPGSVVMVNESGTTPVAEGLPAPFGIAKGADGALYVTFGTVPLGPGMTGGLLKLNAAP